MWLHEAELAACGLTGAGPLASAGKGCEAVGQSVRPRRSREPSLASMREGTSMQHDSAVLSRGPHARAACYLVGRMVIAGLDRRLNATCGVRPCRPCVTIHNRCPPPYGSLARGSESRSRLACPPCGYLVTGIVASLGLIRLLRYLRVHVLWLTIRGRPTWSTSRTRLPEPHAGFASPQEVVHRVVILIDGVFKSLRRGCHAGFVRARACDQDAREAAPESTHTVR